MLKLVDKNLNISKKKINLINKDDEILEQLPFIFHIKGKVFKIDEFTPYQYKIFSGKFIEWLRRFKKLYPTVELIKDFDEYKINQEFINQKINDVNFIYMTYELFKISCYTELYDYEIEHERMTELEKEFVDSKITKFIKKIKRRSIIDYKFFYTGLKRSQISLLFFILLVVNVIGYEKKNRLILEEAEKFLKTKLPSIWQCLIGQVEPPADSHCRIDKKTGEVIYVDFRKSKPLY